jgi:hypothetical protein
MIISWLLRKFTYIKKFRQKSCCKKMLNPEPAEQRSALCSPPEPVEQICTPQNLLTRPDHLRTCWTDLLTLEHAELIFSPRNLLNRSAHLMNWSAHPWTCWTDLLIPEHVEPIYPLNLKYAQQWTDVLNHQLVDEICTALSLLNGCGRPCSCQINLLIREKLIPEPV